MQSRGTRPPRRESDRAACGRQKLDRGLAFGPVFCFVEKEQCGVTAGPRPLR
jgi:hypothetical protein